MEGRRLPRSQQLRRRTSAKYAGDFGSTAIGNGQDVNYNINMTIGTEQRTVTIDTGSSDLWTIGTVENYKSTGLSGDITYAQGSAKGPIFLTDIEFAGHTVTNQAYSQFHMDGIKRVVLTYSQLMSLVETPRRETA